MGLPIREGSSESTPPPSSSEAKQAAPCNGNTPDSSSVQHVFVYGNSRPDITPSLAGEGAHAKRAWLLGGRLYSCNTGGLQRPALRLEEAGHAVLGYTMSLGSSGGVRRLLDAFETREYSLDYYERDVVEIASRRRGGAEEEKLPFLACVTRPQQREQQACVFFFLGGGAFCTLVACCGGAWRPGCSNGTAGCSYRARQGTIVWAAGQQSRLCGRAQQATPGGYRSRGAGAILCLLSSRD